jgi:hypothetical protein
MLNVGLAALGICFKGRARSPADVEVAGGVDHDVGEDRAAPLL